MFDKNKFCAIAKMKRQYDAFNSSLKYLQFEASQLIDVSNEKRKKMEALQKEVTKIMTSISKENLSNFKKLANELGLIKNDKQIKRVEKQ